MKISDDRKMNEHKRILENLLSSTLSEPNAEQHTTSSIAITITCDRIKTLMSEYPDLFPDECNPEADGTVYDKISEIPHDARNVTFALDLHPFNCISFRNSSALVDRMAVSIREDRPLLGNGLYIIEGRVYSSQEAIDNFDSVKNADSCYQLLHAFKHLADYKSGNTCIIIGGVAKLLEYSTNGLKGNDLCDVRCGLDTFLEITNGKDERLKQLLRSEINNHVPTTASPLERIIAFMNSIGTIISSFRLCESQYLNPFESQNLRASYNKKIKDFLLNISGNFAYNRNKVLSLGNIDAQKGTRDIVMVGKEYKAFNCFLSEASKAKHIIPAINRDITIRKFISLLFED